ncbi:copper chaperone CopZ [Sporosarcina sp. 179-K 3D1 HS]|uniref:copper chaperone CopZ n=1 Tax=Sporosarcina sp. 179-K 3D1 HS TaxID=3232169 RepID=UPI0039A2CD0F
MAVKEMIQVKGMSCGHCVKAIEESVGSLKGVERVLVDLETGKVAVEFNNSQVELKQITETIEEQGYDVVN